MRLKNVILYCLLLFCISCSNRETEKVTEELENVVLCEDLVRIGMPERLDYLIENLVLSDEIILLLAENDKMLFENALLNSNKNVKYYTTSKSRAVNMGVYGADLNYLIHFGQTQSSMEYMLVSKQLADQIGVAMAFDQQLIENYQTEAGENDSLINIILGAYDKARRILKNEEQFLLSSMVVAGSWLENMYIATETFNQIKSVPLKSKMVTKLLEQSDYLTYLLSTIEDLDEGDNTMVTGLIKDLHKIDSVYASFGDSLLQESDVIVLNNEIKSVRNRIVNVNNN